MSIFGTDGVRGCFGQFPITPKAFYFLAQAISSVFIRNQKTKKIIIARDTRTSSALLEQALCQGFQSLFPHEIILLGVLPTPALALAVLSHPKSLGFMITASHNLSHDNGVKIFDEGGIKLSENLCREIESEFMRMIAANLDVDPFLQQIEYKISAIGLDIYKQRLSEHIQKGAWQGISLLIDCAHGAYAPIIPYLLQESGASLRLINHSPNGKNINENAAALDPFLLLPVIKEQRADFAIAFDGDGDRLVLFAGEEYIDPHHLLAILYDSYAQKGYTGGLVSTEIANYGLKQYCTHKQISLETTAVGDRFMMEKARERGWLIGAEPSGHYILLDQSPSSDGLLTAVIAINRLLENPELLSTLKQSFPLYDQHSCKIFYPRDLREIWQDILPHLEKILSSYEHLQIKIRLSGTEDVARLVIQAPPGYYHLEDIASLWKEQAASLIQTAFGEL